MDDHDLLIRIDERIENIEKNILEMKNTCRIKTTELTTDIALMKSWKNKMVGAIGLLSAAIGFVFYLCIEVGKKLLHGGS